MLTEAYEQVDLISAHAYYWEEDGDLGSFLASAVDMDHFVESVERDRRRRARAQEAGQADPHLVRRVERLVPAPRRVQAADRARLARRARAARGQYNVADAVVVGNLLISLLRHTDRVHSASLGAAGQRDRADHDRAGRPVLEADDLPPVRPGVPVRGAATCCRSRVEAPTYETAKYGDAALVDAVATRDAETGDVAVFAVNRSLTETVTLEVDARSLPGLRVVEATTLANPDHTWSATADDDTSVVPRANATATVRDGRVSRAGAAGVLERRPAGGLTAVRRAVVAGAVALAAGGRRRRLCAGPTAPAATALSLSGDIHTHDPALVAGAEGEPWYVFSTGDVREGLGSPQIRRSTDDGLTWELVGTVWDADDPARSGSYDAVPGVSNFWAPEVIEHDGTFYLYYSASTFGSNRSAIGLTTNTTLDPDDPDYAWVDQGEVIRSEPGETDYNAIDPGVITDADGTPWMAFGSFWGGIQLVELTWPSGKPVEGAPSRRRSPAAPRRRTRSRRPTWCCTTAGTTCSCRATPAARAPTRRTTSRSVARGTSPVRTSTGPARR